MFWNFIILCFIVELSSEQIVYLSIWKHDLQFWEFSYFTSWIISSRLFALFFSLESLLGLSFLNYYNFLNSLPCLSFFKFCPSFGEISLSSSSSVELLLSTSSFFFFKDYLFQRCCLVLSLSVQFSHSVMSNPARPHGLQHARLLYPSPTTRAFSNSCSLSWWCHLTILSSLAPFSCLQFFPASGSFPMSQFFTSGGQSIGASASALPMNIQDWFPLGLTCLFKHVKDMYCCYSFFFFFFYYFPLCLHIKSSSQMFSDF